MEGFNAQRDRVRRNLGLARQQSVGWISRVCGPCSEFTGVYRIEAD